MTNAQLKTQIDTAITNKTTAESITPSNVGVNIKAVVDYVDQEIAAIPSAPAKISSQVVASAGSPPEINAIDYIRLFGTADGQAVKLTGPHAIGREYYIKNTTAFNLSVNGVVENINGNGSLVLAPGTYWHLVKEDSGTNSITAFKLTII